MATLSNSLIFLCFLLLPGVLVFAGPHGESYPCPCDCPPPKEIQLHMSLHQFPAWGNVTNPNEVAWQGWAADHWLLTWGPDPNQNIAGRARGFHLLTGETSKDWYISHIYVFQDDRFAGSTIQVLGMLDGEWSIIGDTRAFYNARGYIKYKEVPSTISSITDIV
uniref:Dirigent protein n=1 Tax=Setaria italica TaxID=4555 RepID=K3ZL30_SETIT